MRIPPARLPPQPAPGAPADRMAARCARSASLLRSIQTASHWQAAGSKGPMASPAALASHAHLMAARAGSFSRMPSTAGPSLTWQSPPPLRPIARPSQVPTSACCARPTGATSGPVSTAGCRPAPTKNLSWTTLCASASHLHFWLTARSTRSRAHRPAGRPASIAPPTAATPGRASTRAQSPPSRSAATSTPTTLFLSRSGRPARRASCARRLAGGRGPRSTMRARRRSLTSWRCTTRLCSWLPTRASSASCRRVTFT